MLQKCSAEVWKQLTHCSLLVDVLYASIEQQLQFVQVAILSSCNEWSCLLEMNRPADARHGEITAMAVDLQLLTIETCI